jgi:hypothetical protein
MSVSETLGKAIDGLSAHTDWKTGLPALQKILHRVCLLLAESEGALNDTHEEWHGESYSQTMLEIAEDEKTKVKKAMPPGGPAPAHTSPPSPIKPKKKKKPSAEANGGGGNLPPSLMKLLKS